MRSHAAEFSLLGSRNKSGHPSSHHGVEPDVRLDALPNLPHGVFRYGVYVSIRSTHCARQALASKGSAKYCVSRATLSPLNSMMLTV